MIDVKNKKWRRRRPVRGTDRLRKPCGSSLAISRADLCSDKGLKPCCQAIGAARVGGTEEQMLLVIDAYTNRRAEESLELDDFMGHRFIHVSGIHSRPHLIAEIRQREGAVAIGPAHGLGHPEVEVRVKKRNKVLVIRRPLDISPQAALNFPGEHSPPPARALADGPCDL